ncbi:MAG: hypothetical protein N4J56_004592 [Chroococcidiopsis sp. SAG 2025]|uniref:hypothetical protein n=1 Tax=Chroococcidiopsis sp. SAG 2025 TaxID=171389 RepID=UPI002937049A|nr:hypothetical protein [Chroococcidiopsis sp. SAG 2025]MDV2994938.1 hypothetical protein [Chroococcidiopsis sp. SAG 2025]
MNYRCISRLLYPPLLVVLAIASSGCASWLEEAVPDAIAIADDYRPASKWELAARAAPPDLMEQVVQENIDPSWIGDPNRMQVIKIAVAGQQHPVYVINPQVMPPKSIRTIDPSMSPLCGTAGCAYLGYIEEDGTYRRVFHQYLKDKLPPGTTFLKVGGGLTNGLPCLEFTEYPEPLNGTSLAVTRYCYNGRKYVPQDKKLRAILHNSK